jgi:hypothetical protein
MLDTALNELIDDNKRFCIKINEFYPVPEFSGHRFVHPRNNAVSDDLATTNGDRAGYPVVFFEHLLGFQKQTGDTDIIRYAEKGVVSLPAVYRNVQERTYMLPLRDHEQF